MALTYNVNEINFAVSIYTDTQPEPIIYQPNWPNGTVWGSSTDASTWAVLCIASIEDPLAPYAPAGPGLPGEPKNPS